MENTCTPATCGCQARTDIDAVAGALRMRGRMDVGDRRDDAAALLYLLREYGWQLTRRES